MANHIYNKVTCENPEVIKKLLKEVGSNVTVDFNNIIPMPPHQPDLTKPNPFFADGALSGQTEEAFGRENCWYGWSIKNWGTKWNAYDTCYIDNNTLVFFTAWARPEPVIAALSEMFPGDGVTVYSEGGGFSYRSLYMNGVVVDEEDVPYEHYTWDDDEAGDTNE